MGKTINSIAKQTILAALVAADGEPLTSSGLRAALEAAGASKDSLRKALDSLLVDDMVCTIGVSGGGVGYLPTPEGEKAFRDIEVYVAENDQHAVTNTYPETLVCESAFGIVTWGEWCEWELKRLHDKGDSAARIARTNEGQCWITRAPGRNGD